MTIGLRLVTDIGAALREELMDGTADLRDDAVREMKRAAPVRSGKLRRSIRKGEGEVLAEFSEVHGLVQDKRGPHKGWIERGLRRANARFNRGRS